MSARTIRIVLQRVEGGPPYGVRYIVPGRVLPNPLAPDGKVTILRGERYGETPWHPDLSIEGNRAAYDAVSKLKAIGITVIDIGNRADGTSSLGLSLIAPDRFEEVAAILRDAFGLQDCDLSTV